MKIGLPAFLQDYSKIVLGLLIYSLGYTVFLLPYQITTGGVSGIAALIFYSTGFHAQYSYFLINCSLLLFALRIMGRSYVTRTIVATVVITGFISLFQDLITQPDGTLMRCIGDQKFMACVIGGCMEGLGLALVFLSGGSTGGTDIIASCVNKYKDISLGRVLLYADICIISCSYLLFHDIETMVIGYLTMMISMNVLDFVINGARQSVQFIIISERHEDIAENVCRRMDRGVTVLNGAGWYSKEQRQVLLILAKKYERHQLFALIQEIDPKAFVSMSNVEGVFGEGFDRIKK